VAVTSVLGPDPWPIEAALASVRARMAQACERAGRAPESVRLLAVSKYQSLDAMRAAYAIGQREFGENYVQELASKAAALTDLRDLRWHLIGRLQRNKAKDAVRIGCTVQTLDSLRLAESLAARAAELGRVVEVWLQVNLSAEPQKTGVTASELTPLAAAVRALPALKLQGLMTIPNANATPDESRHYFRRLRELAEALGLSGLSMGMSHDLELAIEEGATLVRVGTAIFGARESAALAPGSEPQEGGKSGRPI
jgi:pyridoxal phosphate enzyme (YggS family)